MVASSSSEPSPSVEPKDELLELELALEFRYLLCRIKIEAKIGAAKSNLVGPISEEGKLSG